MVDILLISSTIILAIGILFVHIAGKKHNDVIGYIGLSISIISIIIFLVTIISAPVNEEKIVRGKLNKDREMSISKELNIPEEEIRFELKSEDSFKAISLKGDYYVQFKQETATIVKIEPLKNNSGKE